MTARSKTRPRAVAELARTPERQRLAEVIDAHKAAVAKVTAIEAAVRAARRASVDDHNALVHARKAVAVAEELLADRLVAVAQGLPEPEGMTPDEARAAVTRIEGKGRHHETAIRTLEGKLVEAKRGAAIAKDAIEGAVHAVLRGAPEVERLYCAFAVACKTHATLFNIVSNLPSSSIKPDGIEVDHRPDYELAKRWFAAVDALATDADAELPHD